MVDRLVSEEGSRPFNLAQGPLMRTWLLKLDEKSHAALMTVHHIVSDGWSMDILTREVTTLYRWHSAGTPSPLAELPIQYADFAQWQREWLQGEALDAHLDYWKRHLDGMAPALELPTDRKRPAMKTYRGAHESFSLPPELFDAIKRMNRQERVTTFMILLAAFKALLHRYTGQDDISVGTPIAGRNRIEVEGLVGFFVNTLALRTRLTGEMTFRELLRQAREVVLAAHDHQDLPFEKLVEELQPERDLGRSPLFQVMLTLEVSPAPELTLPALQLSSINSGNSTAKFDLIMYLRDSGSMLTGSLEYSTDLFDAATVRRLLSHFQTALAAAVADPDRRISALPILTEAERQQALGQEGATRVEYPKDACLHQLFEAQVRRAPDRTAVEYEGARLTYDQLNRRANKLAHYLRRLGVGPDSLVGVSVERSLEMIVGIMAILKAGGAYVPIDPTYPNQRTAFILEDTQTPVLLTQERLRDGLPGHGARFICLDTDWPDFADEREDNPASGVTADNLAYVIYTSGSTGRPKGALITHANVVRLFEATQGWFDFNETDVWTLFHSYAFDFSVWEIWGALRYGGKLLIVPYRVSRSPEAFYELLSAEGVTALNQTPTAFTQLIRAEGALGVRELALRYVFFGGEALEAHNLRPWFERHTDQTPKLINMYGITETTVHVTYRPITKEDLDQAQGSLIGGPIPDLQLYILDQYLQPAPLGVAGEILVGGHGLARGYLNQAGLTAERFIPNPFSVEPGARLYKSGDLGRRLANGDTEYLGRIDHQVKVRGYRIEPGEIEAALIQHAAVRETAVVAKTDGAGDKRLVAYLAMEEVETTNAELRSFLAERLPEYMTPSAFVKLDALPLTPSGKVDRRALSERELAPAQRENNYVAPRTMLELKLTYIWDELLDVRPIGVKEDFFALGGHSLLAVRLIARVQQELGVDLPLTALFQASTIERLASLLQEQEALTPWAPLVALQPHGAKPPFFCVHPVGGNVFCYADLARHLGQDQPFYGIQAVGLDGRRSPHTTIEAMATEYIEVIREAQPTGPYYLGGWSMGGVVAFELAQQLKARGEEVALLALLDSSTPVLNDDPSADDDDADVEGFEQGVARVLHEMGMGDVSPREVAPVQYERLFQVYKANMRASRRYAPKPYPGRVSLFRADARSVEDNEALAAGWSDLAAGGVEVFEAPGNHYTMVIEPNVRTLAERLSACLNKIAIEDRVDDLLAATA